MDLGQRRLLIDLSKKGLPDVGGAVRSDEDMPGLSEVQNVGCFGQLIIE